MNELELSNNLQQIELEINYHKQIAGQSIWEIGRRLNHVKENDLTHGQFMEWVEKNGINHSKALRMMKVSKELPNSATLTNLGTEALYLIATLSEEKKQEQIERIENGDNPTVRELREVKRQLKLSQADNQKLYEEKEKLAEQILNQKPIEKEVVVEKIPEDYQILKNRNKELSKKLDNVRWELDSANLELSTLKLESKQAVEIADKVRYLEGKKNKLETLILGVTELSSITSELEEFFDKKMAPLRFKALINSVNAHYSIKEVKKMVDTVQFWCDEMYKIIPEGNRKMAEEVIIDD